MIPEDWNVQELDSISFVTSGKRLPLGKSLTDSETPYPYIRVSDMRPGTVCLDEIKYVPEDVFPAINRYRIFADDIFISVAGTLGIVGKVPPALDGANLTENADRITNISCSQDYLLHILGSPPVQTTIESIQTVGAQPKLALTRIRKFLIPLPPTKLEQEAIAEALSDADAMIEGLERLIAKKRDLKQGAMQELLHSRADWSTRKIGDTLTIMHGKSQHEVEDENGEYPILATGGQIGTAKRFLYDKPSVLIGRKGTIDRPEYMDKPFWTVDTLFYSIVHEPNNAKYLYYQFCLIDWRQHNEASGVPSLNAKTIENIEISMPKAEEQNAIATILSDMDAEIDVLEEKLDKARQIKQGMMQELLTGRVRLI